MPSKAWTPPRVRLLALLFVFITAANVFDLWATAWLIARGYAEEANPLVRDALSFGLRFAYPWKIALVAFATVPLAVLSRRRRKAWIALRVIAVGFAALVAFHLYLLSLPVR